MSKHLLALLHGWGMNSRVFDVLAAQLNDRFDLLQMELPGHGGRPSLTTNTLQSWAAHVAAQLPERTTLLGWSLGGQVAMRIALDTPEKIARLILVSSTPKFVVTGDWQAGIPVWYLQDFGAQLQADPCATLSRFLMLQTRSASAQKSLLEQLRATFFAAPMAESLALTAGLEMLLQTDLREAAARITHPTLVLHGGLDSLTPPEAGAWLAEAIPAAQHQVIDRAAHAPFLSHTGEVAEAIRRFAHD